MVTSSSFFLLLLLFPFVLLCSLFSLACLFMVYFYRFPSFSFSCLFVCVCVCVIIPASCCLYSFLDLFFFPFSFLPFISSSSPDHFFFLFTFLTHSVQSIPFSLFVSLSFAVFFSLPPSHVYSIHSFLSLLSPIFRFSLVFPYSSILSFFLMSSLLCSLFSYRYFSLVFLFLIFIFLAFYHYLLFLFLLCQQLNKTQK